MKNISERLGRTGALVLAVLMIFSVFVARLVDWQIIQTDHYKELAEAQSTDFTKLSAVRGEILDKNGNILAGNKITYSVNLVYQKMDLTKGYDPNPILLKIIDLLESRNEAWKDELPIKIDSSGNYIFDETRPKEIEYMKSYAMLNVQSYATAEECMQALIDRFDCGGYSQKMTRAIGSLRYSMVKNDFGFSNFFTIAGDVSQETVGVINEHLSEMPGIETDVAVTRYYGEDGSLAPHTVGRVGAISDVQYEQEKKAGNVYDGKKGNVEGYTLDDRYGQSGLENVFEPQLRGVNGKKVVNLNNDGSIASTMITQSPKAGNSIQTTIDSKLQAAANKELAKQIDAITDSEGVVTGSAVVLDVKDFGILASANYPTYDMNQYNTDSDYIQELVTDEVKKPLFNRALNGTYTPGSIFKPLVAVAALEEQAINLSTTFTCTGVFEKFAYAGYRPTCLARPGIEDVYSALQNSCNTFFFETGLALGIDKMVPYAESFGLGSKTGVELGESEGSMTNRVDYLKNHPGAAWTEAITIQAAIGQADNSFTPLQLATYAATIANNGVRLKTHFLDKVTDYTGNRVTNEYEPEVVFDAGISDTTMQAVKQGMRRVATDGTAQSVFGNYPVSIGAKTGTAENMDGKSDNATFIAFAPYDNPEIAIAVVIEHGGKGQAAMNVAKAVLDEYFGLTNDNADPDDDNASTRDGLDTDNSTRQGQTNSSSKKNESESSLPPQDGANMNPGAFYKENTSAKPDGQETSQPPVSDEPVSSGAGDE